MTTTPPPRRICTPPTPLHGAQFDSYGPCSPRRSQRVAAQRSRPSPSQTTPGAPRSVRVSTPSNHTSAAHSSKQTFSPPSSPISPHNRGSTSLHVQPAQHINDHFPHSFHDTPRSTSKHFTSLTGPSQFMPTPDKTPLKLKRKESTKSAVNSTARVLFTDRPARIEDSMPTPKRARRNHKKAITLQSFADSSIHDSGHSQIEIYTDIKDRMPTYDRSEDNPFVGSKKPSKKPRANKASAQADTTNGVTQEALDAMKNDEGIVYVFRGKKIFRKFDDQPEEETATDEAVANVGRRAGHQFVERLTRSSIKPRLLFPTEDENAEAVTDIDESEVKKSMRSKKRTKSAASSTPMDTSTVDMNQSDISVDAPAASSTAPKVKRGKKSAVEPAEAGHSMGSTHGALPNDLVMTNSQSPFDSWLRTKASSSSGAGPNGK